MPLPMLLGGIAKGIASGAAKGAAKKFVTGKKDKKQEATTERNIFLLKPIYLGLVIEDQQEFMPYTPGSSQYVSDRLVRGENIRLYN